MHTDVLYSRPSWLTGVARLFDFWGLFDSYNTSKSEQLADSRALAADWMAVGADLQHSMDTFADTLTEELPDSLDAPDEAVSSLSRSSADE